MDSESSKVCALCQFEKGPDGFYTKGRCCKECVKLKVRLSRKRAYEPDEDSSSPGEQMGESAGESTNASLYIFCNPLINDMVKIGRAACPVARAQSMSQSHPFRHTVFQTYYQMGFLEATVHRRLADRRVTSGPGREWFHASPDEADIIVRATLLEHKWRQVSQA